MRVRKGVGTEQSGVEMFDWGEPSNLHKRGNKKVKLEMMNRNMLSKKQSTQPAVCGVKRKRE